MTPTKLCLQCGQAFRGRLDKKFCDDQCRSNFNNQRNSDVSSTMRNINYLLRKNRRILAALLPQSGKTKINKDKLLEIGFDFRYFTHYHKNQKGRIYKACYDYGYLSLESNQVLLTSCKERNSPKIQKEKSLVLNTLNETQENLVKIA